MIEYPSIQNSSKAPRQECIAFDKLDGSNFRAKWTQKRGFDVFGTRTQLIDETSEFWSDMVVKFKNTVQKPLDNLFRKDKDFRDVREIIVFGEYFGENSYAGRHEEEPRKIVVFDIMVGHKLRKFIKPREFIKKTKDVIETPRVVYEGNMNDSLIARVRADEFNTFEGVICKGTQSVGNASGGIWMCKIKTQKYLDSLKTKFGDEWTKYAE
jgi:hypothetical protein